MIPTKLPDDVYILLIHPSLPFGAAERRDGETTMKKATGHIFKCLKQWGKIYNALRMFQSFSRFLKRDSNAASACSDFSLSGSFHGRKTLSSPFCL